MEEVNIGVELKKILWLYQNKLIDEDTLSEKIYELLPDKLIEVVITQEDLDYSESMLDIDDFTEDELIIIHRYLNIEYIFLANKSTMENSYYIISTMMDLINMLICKVEPEKYKLYKITTSDGEDSYIYNNIYEFIRLFTSHYNWLARGEDSDIKKLLETLTKSDIVDPEFVKEIIESLVKVLQHAILDGTIYDPLDNYKIFQILRDYVDGDLNELVKLSPDYKRVLFYGVTDI